MHTKWTVGRRRRRRRRKRRRRKNKRFNITNHKENTNQNHNATSPPPVKMVFIRKTGVNKSREKCREDAAFVQC